MKKEDRSGCIVNVTTNDQFGRSTTLMKHILGEILYIYQVKSQHI